MGTGQPNIGIGGNALTQYQGTSDAYNYPGVDPETAIQEQAINRKRQIANLLMQQGLQAPQGQMVGRFYVRPSIAQNLEQLGKVFAGVVGNWNADADQKAALDASNVKMGQSIEKYIKSQDQTPVPTQVKLVGPGHPLQ